MINNIQLDEGIHDPYIFHGIFCCGAPGSGKTTIEYKLGLEARGLKTLNADQTMRGLKHTQSNLSNVDYPRVGQTTENRFNLFVDHYLGMVLNTTGRNLNTINRLNNRLKENYYNTFMLFVDVDENIARERVQRRTIMSDNPEDKNRIVDMDYFNSAYSSTKNNLKQYENMFGNNFAIVRNDDFETLKEDFEIARKKINKFLMTPASMEAEAIMKGVR